MIVDSEEEKPKGKKASSGPRGRSSTKSEQRPRRKREYKGRLRDLSPRSSELAKQAHQDYRVYIATVNAWPRKKADALVKLDSRLEIIKAAARKKAKWQDLLKAIGKGGTNPRTGTVTRTTLEMLESYVSHR